MSDGRTLAGARKTPRQVPFEIYCAVCVGMVIAFSIRAQSLPPSPSGAKRKFEVASVKPCAPNTDTGTLASVVGPGTATYNCQHLEDYVRSAYIGLATGGFAAPSQIEGGPPWARSDLYKITAKGDGSPMNGTVAASMLRALLEDRFRLKVHKETREIQVYALVATKRGINLPTAKTACYTMNPDQPPPPPPTGAETCAMVWDGPRIPGRNRSPRFNNGRFLPVAFQYAPPVGPSEIH